MIEGQYYNKSRQRTLFKQKNEEALEITDETFLSKNLCKSLNSLNIWKKGLVVASYRAIEGELSTIFFEKNQDSSCKFVFPRICGERMDFSESVEWEQAPWGKDGKQPSRFLKSCPVDKIDVFLVPALAFDSRGHRLGHGWAFYDKLLSKASGLKIGVAAAYQIAPHHLPVEEHDVPMDVVCTDSGCFIFNYSLLKKYKEGGV